MNVPRTAPVHSKAHCAGDNFLCGIGGVLDVLRQADGGWVCIVPLCDALGIQPRAQQKRLQRAPWAVASMMDGTATDGKIYQMYCLRADKLAMFLATLEVSRIRNAAARKRIAKYQKHAAAALDRWVRGKEAGAQQAERPRLPAPPALPELVEDVRMPQPIMAELVAQLRASREAQAVHLNLLMQVTQRLAGPQQQVPVLPPAAPADPEPPAAAPARAKKPRAKPAPKPEPAEEFVSGAQVAAEIGIAPSSFSRWVKSHNEVRKLQRADGKWPLMAIFREYAAAQERATQKEREREERKTAPTARSEIRNGIVMWVRGYCGALKMNGEQIAEVWNNIYQRFAAALGYDPREHKGKGQRALDVVEERGHLRELDRVAMEVCPPRHLMPGPAEEKAPPPLTMVGHA